MGTLTDLIGQTVYLDANVLIYFVEAHPQYAPRLVGLFRALDQGTIHAITSELTLAECLVKPFLDADPTRQQTYQELLAPGTNLRVIPVSRPILIAAAELRASHKPRLPDAIHLATALQSACQTFLTNDRLVKPVPGLTVLQLSDLTA